MTKESGLCRWARAAVVGLAAIGCGGNGESTVDDDRCEPVEGCAESVENCLLSGAGAAALWAEEPEDGFWMATVVPGIVGEIRLETLEYVLARADESRPTNPNHSHRVIIAKGLADAPPATPVPIFEMDMPETNLARDARREVELDVDVGLALSLDERLYLLMQMRNTVEGANGPGACLVEGRSGTWVSASIEPPYAWTNIGDILAVNYTAWWRVRFDPDPQ